MLPTGLEALVADGEAQFEAALNDTTAALDRLRRRRGACLARPRNGDSPRRFAARCGERAPGGVAKADRAPACRRRSTEATVTKKARARSTAKRWHSTRTRRRSRRRSPSSRDGWPNGAFRRRLSAGYSALDAGRFDDARAAFNRALKERPGDRRCAPGPRTGRTVRYPRSNPTAPHGGGVAGSEERWAKAS